MHSLVATSGSTGAPRLVRLTGAMCDHAGRAYTGLLALTPEDRTPVHLPMWWVSGHVTQLSSALVSGGSVVTMPAWSPAGLVGTVARHGATWLDLVPTLWHGLLREDGFDAARLPTLRAAVFGGAPAAPEVLAEVRRRLPRLALLDAYAMSEVPSPIACLRDEEAADAPGQRRAGRARTSAWRSSTRPGRALPAGSVGAVAVRSPALTPGYEGAAALDVDREGRYRTGDLGVLDDDGFLTLTGRAADRMIRGGVTIHPAEVERALLASGLVVAAAVLPVPSRLHGDDVGAVVVPAGTAADGPAGPRPARRRGRSTWPRCGARCGPGWVRTPSRSGWWPSPSCPARPTASPTGRPCAACSAAPRRADASARWTSPGARRHAGRGRGVAGRPRGVHPGVGARRVPVVVDTRGASPCRPDSTTSSSWPTACRWTASGRPRTARPSTRRRPAAWSPRSPRSCGSAAAPGSAGPGAPGEAGEPFASEDMHLVPVGLSEEEVADYYEGMSNGTLWPLFHDVIAAPEYHRSWWDAYVRVNRRFADAAAAQAADGATVWVQDYQLLLVPARLRELRPGPADRLLQPHPVPRLRDLQPAAVAQAGRRGGARRRPRRVPAPLGRGELPPGVPARRRRDDQGRHGPRRTPGRGHRRVVRAGAFPISIDARGFEELAASPDVRARAEQIRKELGDPEHVLLGVDRLDYTKGIRHRLTCFAELLADGELHPESTVLVQVASPSRERVQAYADLRDEVELTVGRINGDHGTVGFQPVHYLHQSFPREEMAALYLAADVMLVTALRDGMNLVAKEYVAARHDSDGVLVLSEFAGAADELSQALLINPHDIAGTKAAVMRATRMPREERRRRMRALRRRVVEHDVERWATDFLEALAGRAEQPDAG